MNEAIFYLVRAVLPDRLRGTWVVADFYLKCTTLADAPFHLDFCPARHFLSGKGLGRGHYKMIGGLFEPNYFSHAGPIFISHNQLEQIIAVISRQYSEPLPAHVQLIFHTGAGLKFPESGVLYRR